MPDTQKPGTKSQDNRRSSRKRTLFSGKVTYAEGAHSLDCTIRDLSQTGARISVKGAGIPSMVYLIDIRNSIAYEAKVEWSRPPDFGLVFLKAHPIMEISAPRLEYLKRLWMACSGR